MKKLKKIVLKVPVKISFDLRYEFFNIFEKYELFQIHRFDDDQIYVSQKVKFKDEKMHPKMLEGDRYGMSFIEVIEENKAKNEFIFFSKNNLFNDTKKFLDKLDLIIDPPIVLDRDYLLVSIISESKNIDAFCESLENFYSGDLEILSITRLHPNHANLFLELTDRQKEIVYYAIQHGYFEIPRKIDSEKIANHFEISQSALYHHLRKVERTIYYSIFT
ncbi:MAG: helix-turn-helix domain-containing protein [Candidatus Lokiarchaeota archaeon]|nr:helix-turn-helix domain-containing protein [Candidatus Lokiarchaeota archaeon]